MGSCRSRNYSGGKQNNIGALGLLSVRHKGIMYRKGSESKHIKESKVMKT